MNCTTYLPARTYSESPECGYHHLHEIYKIHSKSEYNPHQKDDVISSMLAVVERVLAEDLTDVNWHNVRDVSEVL
jgi:hypothetical protein